VGGSSHAQLDLVILSASPCTVSGGNRVHPASQKGSGRKSDPCRSPVMPTLSQADRRSSLAKVLHDISYSGQSSKASKTVNSAVRSLQDLIRTPLGRQWRQGGEDPSRLGIEFAVTARNGDLHHAVHCRAIRLLPAVRDTRGPAAKSVHVRGRLVRRNHASRVLYLALPSPAGCGVA
jgi:hypothetical protein